MQPAVLAGWRTILKINNEVVGAGFVLDYQIETSETTIQCIDNVLPDELAPQNISVRMSIRVYRTPDNDPVSGKIAPLGAASNPQEDFTKSPYISVEVRDKVTDKTVIFLPRAWLTNRSGSVDSEGLLVETWQIKSIGYIGPTGQISSIFGAVGGIFSGK